MNAKALNMIFQLTLLLVCTIECGCEFSGTFPSVDAQDSNNATPERRAMLENLKMALAVGSIKVPLSPVDPTSSEFRIRWSPKGTKVPLTRDSATLNGELKIGNYDAIPIALMVTPEKGLFQIDLNLDGSFSETEINEVKPSISRGKTWYSTSTVISLPSGNDNVRAFPISIWYVHDPEQPDAQPVIRWSRKGWHEGSFKLNGKQCYILIADANNNGTFEKSDAFGLGTSREELFELRNCNYRISKHGWLNGVSYRIVDVEETGRHVTIEAFDVGVTENEDRQANDAYAADRRYPRAKDPVEFLTELDAAISKATKEDKLIVVDFVTTWCGPCKTMDELVYTAKPIVAKSVEFVFVKLDGDDEKKLVKQFEVTGYPTLLVLDSNKNVLKRRSGYQSVSQLLKLMDSLEAK